MGFYGPDKPLRHPDRLCPMSCSTIRPLRSADLTGPLRRFASRKGAGVGAGSRSVSYAVACRRQYSPPFSDLIEWALPHRWRATWAVLSGCEAMTINDFLETVLVRLARS
ncbi:uncharacterized protein PGTG_17206 [Puccinia graminis f. sp. tritici CRL 75-36-700-3]|uniref:Uncharacterized protein n=1 Tax=Puccinia graminis f. sp. tritici (strain CRL 75-36-700-3 / race SCCL) TaxID=418459 RepID=E3L309_PUCGT|nr:uncharacterized protein PGTG_17206 [Puccinia graminis f. sp. tritici CRL 75-36-700-3]EFP90934.2 hypothetical protein PGTG_17206 [Puccinia graminis f. sp. tritici CRL 75-36-700-3]